MKRSRNLRTAILRQAMMWSEDACRSVVCFTRPFIWPSVACGSRVFSRTVSNEPQHPSSLGLLYCGTRAELPKSPELGNEVLASADSSVNRAAAFVAHERVAFVWL